MAGATKLLGFGPNCVVMLERWGTTSAVAVPEEAWAALREACHRDLPKQPPELQERSCQVVFLEPSREVYARMPVSLARSLGAVLESVENGRTDGISERLLELLSGIGDALKASEAYLDPSGEPGTP